MIKSNSIMKTNLLRTLGIGSLVFVGIQFIVPDENHYGNSKNDIVSVYNIPDNVQTILKTSCFNCHSNNTNYPWYTRMQPVRWWISGHIANGKEKMNFSNFAAYNAKMQYSRFKEIEEKVKSGTMPLPSYLTTHPESVLSEKQKTILINWAKAMQDSMKAKYSMDSLADINSGQL
jgi:Haem-binding domain